MKTNIAFLAVVFGECEDAERLPASTPPVNQFNHAFVCGGLGDRERGRPR